MTLNDLASLSAVVALIVSAAAWAMSQKIDNLAEKVGGWREHDKREIQEWINGSFMRSKEVQIRMENLEERLERVCERMESIESRHHSA